MASFRKAALLKSIIMKGLSRAAAEGFEEEFAPEAPAEAAPAPAPAPAAPVEVPAFLKNDMTAVQIYEAILRQIESTREIKDEEALANDLRKILPSVGHGVLIELIRNYKRGRTEKGKPLPTREDAGAHAQAVIGVRNISNAIHRLLNPTEKELLSDAEISEALGEVSRKMLREVRQFVFNLRSSDPALTREQAIEAVKEKFAPSAPATKPQVAPSEARNVEVNLEEHPDLKEKIEKLNAHVAGLSQLALQVGQRESRVAFIVKIIQNVVGPLASASHELSVEDSRQRAKLKVMMSAAAQAARAETNQDTLLKNFQVGSGSQGKPVSVSERWVFEKAKGKSLEELANLFEGKHGAEIERIFKIFDSVTKEVQSLLQKKEVTIGELRLLMGKMSAETRSNFVAARKYLALARKDVEKMMANPKWARDHEIVNLSNRIGSADSLVAQTEQALSSMFQEISAKYSLNHLLRIAEDTAVAEPEVAESAEQAPAEEQVEEEPESEPIPKDVANKIEDINAGIDENLSSLLYLDDADMIADLLNDTAAIDDEINSQLEEAVAAFGNAESMLEAKAGSFMERKAQEDEDTLEYLPGSAKKPKKKKTDIAKGKTEVPSRPKFDKPWVPPGVSEDPEKQSFEESIWSHLPDQSTLRKIVDDLKTYVGANRRVKTSVKDCASRIKDSWNYAEEVKAGREDRKKWEQAIRNLQAVILPEIASELEKIDPTINKAQTTVNMGDAIVEFTGKGERVINADPKEVEKWRSQVVDDWAHMAEQLKVPLMGTQTANDLITELDALLMALGPVSEKPAVTTYVPNEALTPGAEALVNTIEEGALPSPEKMEESMGDARSPEVSETGMVSYGPGEEQVPSAEQVLQGQPPLRREQSLDGMVRSAEEETETDISDQIDAVNEHAKKALAAAKKMASEASSKDSVMEKLEGAFESVYNTLSSAWSELTKAGPAIMDWFEQMLGKKEEAASGGKMERKANDFSHFDVSENKLEIVESDGKRRLTINKNLKNLVTKRVVELSKGSHPNGVDVKIDCDDYLADGVVQSYLGNDLYSVKIEGRLLPIEVEAKRIISIEAGPWR